MNRIYRSVWSESTGEWVAVSEVTKDKSKNARSSKSVVKKATTKLPFSAKNLVAAFAFATLPFAASAQVTCTTPNGTIGNVCSASSITDSIVINNNISISTTNAGASNGHALAGTAATTTTGSVTITNSGALTTTGSVAHGIYTSNAIGGAVEVINSGTINVTGAGSHGISLSSSDGDITVTDTAGQTINATQSGIWTVGKAVTINSNSTITIDHNIGAVGTAVSGLRANSVVANDSRIINYSGNSLTLRNSIAASEMAGTRATDTGVGIPSDTSRSEVNLAGNVLVSNTFAGNMGLYGVDSVSHGAGDVVSISPTLHSLSRI